MRFCFSLSGGSSVAPLNLKTTQTGDFLLNVQLILSVNSLSAGSSTCSYLFYIVPYLKVMICMILLPSYSYSFVQFVCSVSKQKRHFP